jgi:anti-sigma factor RsiW
MNTRPDSAPRSPHGAAVPLPVSDTMLQAYVDGHLDEDQRQQVADWLEQHPDRAAQVAGYDALNTALHHKYDPVLEEAVPERFLRLLADAEPGATASAASTPAAPSSPGKTPFLWHRVLAWLAPLGGSGPGLLAPAMPGGNWRMATLMATVVWMGLGGLVGWQVGSQTGSNGLPPMVRHAAVAYVTYASEEVHPVEIGAGDEAHLVAWLSRRLGMNLKPARLDDLGYRLMGGRLLAGTQRPVAQFMYEDQIGRRLTLYVKTQESGHDQSIPFRFAQEGEVNAYYWVENGTGYVLSSNLDRNDLIKVAEAVYAQINTPRPSPGQVIRQEHTQRQEAMTRI